MAKALENPPSPRKKSPTKRTPTPSIREIGTILAAELGAIIERMGPDHPDLISQLLRYIQQLDQQHPDWRPVMEQARDRLIGGKLGGQINRRPH